MRRQGEGGKVYGVGEGQGGVWGVYSLKIGVRLLFLGREATPGADDVCLFWGAGYNNAAIYLFKVKGRAGSATWVE